MKIEVEKIESFTGHKDSVYAISQSLSDRKFLSSGGDGLIVEWDISKSDLGKPIAKLKNSIYALAFEKREGRLWLGQNYEGIHVLDLNSNEEIKTIALNKHAIFDIKLYDNKAIVAGGDGVITVLDSQKMMVVKHIKSSAKSVRTLAINPQKKEFAAGFSDHTIRIFDINTFELKKQIHAHRNSVFSLAYTSDYKYLLSGSRDAHLKIWSTLKNYEMMEQIVAHMYTINSIDFNPGGTLFATSSMDKSIKIWNAQTFQLLKVIDQARYAGHGTSVNKLHWLNDNSLISGSDDRSLSLWKIKMKK